MPDKKHFKLNEIAENGNIGAIDSQTQGYFKINEFSTLNCSMLSNYSFGNQIGKGAYAIVKECIHKPSGTKVAIKQYDRRRLLDS